MNTLEVETYLDPYFLEVESLGLDLKNYPLDHLGFSATSKQEYEFKKSEFLIFGQLIREHIVSGRRVAVFKLKTIIKYKQYSIEAIELVEPKEDEDHPVDGFEHAEFTIDTTFAEIVNQYPGIPWDTSSMNRADFPRLKLVFKNGTELKLNLTPILEEA
jgi:predicted metalloenzyme YecM